MNYMGQKIKIVSRIFQQAHNIFFISVVLQFLYKRFIICNHNQSLRARDSKGVSQWYSLKFTWTKSIYQVGILKEIYINLGVPLVGILCGYVTL